MTVGAIDLTAEENAILRRIVLDQAALRDHEDWKKNAQAVPELMASLIKRNAIPQVRWKYFVDPDYYPGGRGKSRKENFERDGTRGRGIFEHANFLKYLQYFLYGAQLPTAVIDGFVKEVRECGMVSSGDVVPLGKFARQQARQARIPGDEAADEFYKLAIDCGIFHSYASTIRDLVKRLR